MQVKKSLYIFFIVIRILNFYNNQNLDPIHDSLRISIAFSLFLRSSWSLHNGRCSINIINAFINFGNHFNYFCSLVWCGCGVGVVGCGCGVGVVWVCVWLLLLLLLLFLLL